LVLIPSPFCFDEILQKAVDTAKKTWSENGLEKWRSPFPRVTAPLSGGRKYVHLFQQVTDDRMAG